MHVRRLFAVVCLTLSGLLLLAGCSNDPTVPPATSAPVPAATLPPTQQPTPVPTPTPMEQPTPEPTATPVPTSTPEPTATPEASKDEEKPGPSRVPGMDLDLTEREVSVTFDAGGETKEVVIASPEGQDVLKTGDVVKTGADEEVRTDITVEGFSRIVRTAPVRSGRWATLKRRER